MHPKPTSVLMRIAEGTMWLLHDKNLWVLPDLVWGLCRPLGRKNMVFTL